jgi:hypothetical protein
MKPDREYMKAHIESASPAELARLIEFMMTIAPQTTEAFRKLMIVLVSVRPPFTPRKKK